MELTVLGVNWVAAAVRAEVRRRVDVREVDLVELARCTGYSYARLRYWCYARKVVMISVGGLDAVMLALGLAVGDLSVLPEPPPTAVALFVADLVPSVPARGPVLLQRRHGDPSVPGRSPWRRRIDPVVGWAA